MTSRNGDLITYNALNKPAIMKNKNGKEVRFYYGIGGARYMKTTAEKDTYYIGKSYEEQVEGSEETQICYITIGGKTIGTRTQVINTDYVSDNDNYAETPFYRYFHTDALGSITSITDKEGDVVERRSYEAFGKIRAMDYGTNNNTFANTTIETTRAFTGHEQIAELSGLIHMNARVYDSDIGRFLSADTIIQAPHDSQSYNRYSYVRNNPLVFTDPSGHSWFSKIWKKVKSHLRTIVAIVVAAVIAIYLPGLMLGPNIFSTMVAGSGALTLSTVGVMTVGAVAGFASGAIMTGSLKGALQGAMWGAISAGVAYGIGGELGHAGGIFTKGVKSSQAWLKAAAHGLSRGIISVAQGGTFKAGFASGFSASFFSPGTTMGGDKAGGFGLRTSIAAIVGGTASSIGGGKFSNGAVSGAFVHMFNAEARGFIGRKALMARQMVQSKEAYSNLTDSLLSRHAFFKANPTYGTEGLKLYGALVTLPFATLGALRLGILAETAVVSYPVETIYGGAIVNDFYNESLPPVTIPGQIWYGITHTKDLHLP